MNRRFFIKKSTLSALTTLVGMPIIFQENIPKNWLPLGFTSDPLPGKDKGLILLNDKPINAETPPHLLDDKITPASRLFVRNNGIPPVADQIDLKKWTLTIEGEAARKKVILSLDDLKTKFKTYSYQLTLECGGNGRSEFNPPAKGNQWSTGAVGCPRWTGVRLKDVLNYAGIRPNAQYIGYYGKDTHLSGDPKKVVISRGVPIKKALEEESLIAWAINDTPLPLLNGYPLRLVFGGWPASTSGKWLTRIVIRDRVHDGPKMEGQSYKVPCNPVAPGASVKDEDMCIIESMPVKSLITTPKTGGMLKFGQPLKLRGHAWAGDFEVKKMEVSFDFGATWQICQLERPANRLAWQHWSVSLKLPKKGYYEIWAKATDSNGIGQPMLIPNWNPKGYLNNACHRIAVKVV